MIMPLPSQFDWQGFDISADIKDDQVHDKDDDDDDDKNDDYYYYYFVCKLLIFY